VAVMVASENPAGSRELTWAEREELHRAAEYAALVLLMASEANVHEDYRPRPNDIAWAADVTAQWREAISRPMPPDEPRVQVAPRSTWVTVVNLPAEFV